MYSRTYPLCINKVYLYFNPYESFNWIITIAVYLFFSLAINPRTVQPQHKSVAWNPNLDKRVGLLHAHTCKRTTYKPFT
jgi:hypothetical protein